MKYGVAIRFIGDISLFDGKIRKSVAEIVEMTKDNNKYINIEIIFIIILFLNLVFKIILYKSIITLHIYQGKFSLMMLNFYQFLPPISESLNF